MEQIVNDLLDNNITKLVLCDSINYNEETDKLASAIFKNTSLVHIEFSGVQTYHTKLFMSLHNKKLTYLSLHINFDDYCADELSNFLLTNTTLVTLNLGCNRMNVNCCYALANFLSTNTSLINLHLGGNCVNDKCAIILANALLKNTSLKLLEYQANCIGSQGSIALANALLVNNTLSRVRGGGSRAPKKGK